MPTAERKLIEADIRTKQPSTTSGFRPWYCKTFWNAQGIFDYDHEKKVYCFKLRIYNKAYVVFYTKQTWKEAKEDFARQLTEHFLNDEKQS